MTADPADDYFELFGIEPAYRIEIDRVRRAYLRLQQLLHPDRHAVSGGRARRLAGRGAALVNEAYRVLCDDCERAAYLLARAGAPVDDSATLADDPEFLAEQLELREALAEAGGAPPPALRERLAERRRALDEDFDRALRDRALDDARATVMKMRFIRKLSDEADARLADAPAAD